MAQGFLTPEHLAQTGQDTTESKESWVLSLHDGIGCLAHGIKDEFSSMGYTKYIALEPDPRLRTIPHNANPRSQVDDNTRFPGIQYGINYKIDSPHEVMLKHTEKVPQNSIKLPKTPSSSLYPIPLTDPVIWERLSTLDWTTL